MHFILLLSAYLCVASFCWWVDSKNEEQKLEYGHITLWLIFGMIILMLGVCRFFEAHVLLTVLTRTLVGEAYSFHREIQAFLLGGLATFGCIVNAGCLYALRKRLDHLVGFVGIELLVGLFVLRSLSYHHTDLALGLEFGGVSIANLCEAGGLILVITAGLFRRAVSCAICHARLSCPTRGSHGPPIGWPKSLKEEINGQRMSALR